MKTWPALLLFASSLLSQSPEVRLPDESAGIDGVVQTLISVFDQTDIIGLGEAHGRKADSDLRIALVRHPDFAKKVRAIVVEFGSTTEQSTLDRYIRGEGLEDHIQRSLGLPNLRGLFHGRDVNSKLPAGARIRVFGATLDQQTSATAKPRPSQFLRSRLFRSMAGPW